MIVTGGSGAVGLHLKQVLPEATYLSSADYDLRDYSQAVAMIKDHNPTTIIHLAAKVGGILENINNKWDYYEDNVRINSNVLMAAKAAEVKNMIAVLSTCMYGDFPASDYPLTEDMIHQAPPPKSNEGYAMSKRCMATGIDILREDGYNYCYLIPCNLYSEHSAFGQGSHFLNALIAKIADAKQNGLSQIELFGTGEPLRQFMYAGDLANIIRLCVKYRYYKNMNVAPDHNLSIKEMTVIAMKACKVRMVVNWNTFMPDGQFRKDVAGNLVAEFFPEFEFTELMEGIGKVYRSYAENQKEHA